MALPEGVPTVEGIDTEPAVVPNTLPPDSLTEVKSGIEGKDFQAIYFKKVMKES